MREERPGAVPSGLTDSPGFGPALPLPNVPYTQYFYQGYGLHGTYWHHNFGTPMSHGC
ncbi:MAG: L,D-transpeptidase, partial [Acidobacteriia bacterium]|nr:L,D-transpeptidase [Terriglobia bacterium]